MASKVLYTNYYLIDSFSIKELDALAIYYKVKKKYHNSVVYDFDYKSFADKLNISYHKANKYIKLLKEKGIVYKHGNNLVFQSMAKSIGKLCDYTGKKRSNKINIGYNDSVEDIKDKLITIKLYQEVIRQNDVVRLKADVSILEERQRRKWNKKLVKKVKKITKLSAKYPQLSEKSKANNVVNCRKFGKYLNVSASTMDRILIRLNNKKYIKRTKVLEKLNIEVNNGFNDYINNNDNHIGYYYIYNNILYNYIGTETTFNMDIFQ